MNAGGPCSQLIRSHLVFEVFKVRLTFESIARAAEPTSDLPSLQSIFSAANDDVSIKLQIVGL